MFKSILVSSALAVGLSVAAVVPSAQACPPGLAKKNPPCVPPGQVGKDRADDDRDRDRVYRRGDYINGRYSPIDNPWQYGLDRDDSYARVGNYVYRIDRETREVLDLIGAVSAILN